MSQYVPIELPQVPSSAAGSPRTKFPRLIVRLQIVTLAWTLIECGVSLTSAKTAHSPALLAFGSDSLVELFSAAVVLLPFLPSSRVTKRKAARMAAILLFVLAAVVALTAISALISGLRPLPSPSGIAITVAALLAMPVLASKKKAAALATNNQALAADAVQSATCAYLAAVTLLGLGVNALFHFAWVDSAASLIAIPILVIEGRRAWHGESCGCC
jgi:divalent metal cation (Fe/Co/Zn/Cd) transporter